MSCDATRIWSHLLLSGLRERPPNSVPSLRRGPDQLEFIHDATMQGYRVDHLASRQHMAPACSVNAGSWAS